ncbi:MAG: pilus assembly protein [Hyphomicrobiaceae bacterium]|nr:pilus assembly protein [Hyphomicrobiaceae bacterium]
MNWKHQRDFAFNRQGSIAILFGLLSMVIFGMVGFAIDYTRAVNLETHMSQALDAAVLAGVRAAESERQQVATNVFNENMGEVPELDISLHFETPASGQFTGTAETAMPAYIAAILGVKTMPVNVASTAATNSSGKVCILVLDKTATQSFLVNSGAKIDAPACEIHVHSQGSPAAIFNSGSSLDTKRICIKGSTIIDNGGFHPNTKTSCDPAADPYVGRFPVPANATCDYSNMNYNGRTVHLNPGVYCGWTNFNNQPNVTFAPGVYVIKNGGWNVNGGTWDGNGVTFYFADTSKIQFNSAVAARLTPPSSGSYENVIITEKEGLAHSHFVLDDSRGFNISGLVYLPSRDTIFNSASNIESKDFTLVVNTLILDDTNWKLDSTSTEISSSGAVNGSVRLIH